MNSKKYIIKPTNKFKKCYAKLKKQKNFARVRAELETVLDKLSNNEILDQKYHNHLLNPKSKRGLGMSYIA